ncbi:MAG: hypothetical protein JWN27_4035 [Candidatus Eremiobacteraeota bacterium]|jgi:hypothetical protein|nr:hypothetical protein [Candidatus Eremiobacteraeota bacterium]
MIPFPKLFPLLSAAALASVALISPLTANAQDQPSYARPAPGSDNSIKGRIQSINGAYNLTVLDDRGSVDSVQLHQGTIINPTGLTLASGMSVTITGYNAGSTFDANEIDTPYAYDGPVYYGGYPDYNYGFFFGDRFHGGFHGDRFHGGGFHGGGFHGGGFHGGGFHGGGFHGGGGHR